MFQAKAIRLLLNCENMETLQKQNYNVDQFLSIESEIKSLKKALKWQEEKMKDVSYALFQQLVNYKIYIDSIVTIGTVFEYKVVDFEIITLLDDEKKKYFEVYVYITRVKKGTDEFLNAYQNGVSPKVYSQRVMINRIKEVIKK